MYNQGGFMVLDKPEIKVDIREGSQTEYGTPEPVARLVFASTHYRAAHATLLRLAAEVQMLSIDTNWGVMVSDGISVLGAEGGVDFSCGTVKLSLDEGTHAEAVRGSEVLAQAVAKIKKSEWFRTMFQGGQVSEPLWSTRYRKARGVRR
jgi:hypothetical protein